MTRAAESKGVNAMALLDTRPGDKSNRRLAERVLTRCQSWFQELLGASSHVDVPGCAMRSQSSYAYELLNPDPRKVRALVPKRLGERGIQV